MKEKKKAKAATRSVRIIGRELSTEEMVKVSGGLLSNSQSLGDTDDHSGTCTNEQDCD